MTSALLSLSLFVSLTKFEASCKIALLSLCKFSLFEFASSLFKFALFEEPFLVKFIKFDYEKFSKKSKNATTPKSGGKSAAGLNLTHKSVMAL